MDENAVFYNAQPNTTVAIRGETYLRERPHTNTGGIYTTPQQQWGSKKSKPPGEVCKIMLHTKFLSAWI